MLEISRRRLLQGSLGAGLMALPALRAAAVTPVPTRVIETTGGKLRGLREGPVSAFRGIPYGADTGPRRFMAPLAAPAWSGVRDAFRFGHRPTQGVRSTARMPADSPNLQQTIRIGTQFTIGQVGTDDQSEDCLFLNVFTPNASPRRKRPVMFWLHGGGFSIGSGIEDVYEGGALAAHGDVVVVTINHRLYSPGFLYLADFHADFADSGMAGQLDQVLALRWVHDNIAQFGGDPGNVTIFGESGGGHKVSCLLAMPAAKGLFHKAIIQSGAGVRMVEAADATAFAEKVLGNLGIARNDVHKLQTLPIDQLLKACGDAEKVHRTGRTLSPVVDGRNLPAHPFDPAASKYARNIPIVIGTCKDEATLFTMGDAQFGTMTVEQARERFNRQLGPRGPAAFDLYSKTRPGDAPTYWFTSMSTDSGHRFPAIQVAERKVQQGGAPAFMYRLDMEMPAFGGILRAPHGIDTPMVFGHPDEFARILGGGETPRIVSRAMMDAWTAFARTGNPSTKRLAWPRYDLASRKTMMFSATSQVVTDPERAIREFWAS